MFSGAFNDMSRTVKFSFGETNEHIEKNLLKG